MNRDTTSLEPREWFTVAGISTFYLLVIGLSYCVTVSSYPPVEFDGKFALSSFAPPGMLGDIGIWTFSVIASYTAGVFLLKEQRSRALLIIRAVLEIVARGLLLGPICGTIAVCFGSLDVDFFHSTNWILLIATVIVICGLVCNAFYRQFENGKSMQSLNQTG